MGEDLEGDEGVADDLGLDADAVVGCGGEARGGVEDGDRSACGGDGDKSGRGVGVAEAVVGCAWLAPEARERRCVFECEGCVGSVPRIGELPACICAIPFNGANNEDSPDGGVCWGCV